jgi:RND family efflux transporter MFP subunit
VLRPAAALFRPNAAAEFVRIRAGTCHSGQNVFEECVMKMYAIKIGAIGLATAGAIAASALWGPKWARKPADESGNAAASSGESPNSVVVPEEKFKTMKISSVSVARQSVQDARTVPGQIAYKHVSRVDLKAPVNAIVEKVRLKPGDAVKPGARIADLTSPEIGVARADVEKTESDLKIASQALEYTEEITRNLNELLKFLRGSPQPEAVEDAFDDKVLGDHRQEVLMAYSRYVLAEKQWASAERAVKNAAISEVLVRERQSNREVAKAQFLAIGDQSRFNARQALEKARQNQVYSKRLVDVKKRQLRNLLGAFSEIVDTDESIHEDGSELTRFYLVAPFAGTVEDRLTSDSQRVDAGTVLFVFADTEVLEVEANVYEGDWQAVSPYFADGEGQIVKIKVPFGETNREFDAAVEYIGRTVDPEKRAVELHAEFDNSKLALKPGMRAWITIPAGEARDELVVPSAAVLTHERQTFVFVEDEREPRKYLRVDVTVGKTAPEGTTITSGLTAGQRVVVEGAFLLKSELLLERGEE